MKGKFWTSDWFAVLVIAIAMVIFSRSELLQGLERTTYDIGVRSAKHEPGDRVAIIAIDDESIENIGRWPWPRDIQADMIDKLRQAGAKVIGVTSLLSEAQTDPGLKTIRQLQNFYANSSLAHSADDDIHSADLTSLSEQLGSAALSLDTDRRLAASIGQANNVVLGMQMNPGVPLGNPDAELPPYVSQYQVLSDGAVSGLPFSTTSVVPPIAAFGEPAAGIGHIVTLLDVDGAVRFEPLLLNYYGQLYPSLSLVIAAKSLNLGPDDIQTTASGIRLGALNIGTDSNLLMNSYFYSKRDDRETFTADSFYDVYTGKIDPAKYKGRIVLIGATAFGLGSTLKTPLPRAMEPVKVVAHTVASILNEDFFTLPPWANALKWALILLVLGYLMFALPRLGAGLGAGLSLIFLVAFLGVEIILLGQEGLWLPMTLPAVFLFVGHLALTTKHFLITEQGKEKSDKEGAESNKMLGLAFQQQGQLDMAFDKFRRVPPSDDLMDVLYNLAMDFERKRQFNKASAVYNYIAKHDASFRDIKQRTKRANDAQDTIIFGAKAISGGPGDTLIGEGGFEKPMLGRYQVEKELGRGAMGIVYQGRDPKINRVVAIKTLSLADEFEAEELQEIKERFFLEAEAAGRLNHPGIVTVYDAGEEHDLAYIAMEFLSGHDLLRYTKPDALLPVEKVLNLMLRAAEALDYAHTHTIVHRDIKPANLMYDPEIDQLKVTDFGIARVSNSSKTKTGMVVGTPSYMSPEQVTGKRVDGRSDIFSLGVMLYQMLTSELPFQAENATQIMYKIATEKHPNILETRPGIKRSAPWISIVLNRALEKDIDKRYQRGQLMANDIKAVLKKMAAASQRAKSQPAP
jgi:CHASE2 domain-containing sensor protein/tRNA A-37 threonylcarbamoyl transferase component Bud32|tara:strand:- start:25792 stop:28362 length:2571 start_codon:yes stop_codon:yes gene_type:complete